MRSWLRSRRGTLVLAALVWAAGCLVIWWALPVVPRSWQPPADQTIMGFLSDGRTLVTANLLHEGNNFVSGPIRLWDVDTGQLRASHFGSDDAFNRVFILHNPDRLMVGARRHEGGIPSQVFDVRLVDALSGKDVPGFSCHASMGADSWQVSPDGTRMAFETYNDHLQPLIEWHDLVSGRLLQRLEWASAPFVFSSDGRRFAALRYGNPKLRAFTVWEVPTGCEIASVPSEPGGVPPPVEFSADGQLVRDEYGNVRDVATGKIRLQVWGSCTFSADGRWLIVGQPAAKELVIH
jgi:WD40 repeat protein